MMRALPRPYYLAHEMRARGGVNGRLPIVPSGAVPPRPPFAFMV